MVDASRTLTNRGEDGCKGCTMQSGHDEHRLGRHFGLLYSRRVTWQENHGSPWPSKIGIVWCYLRSLHSHLYFAEGLLLFRGILLLSWLLSSFLPHKKNSKLVSSTSTFGSLLQVLSLLPSFLESFETFMRFAAGGFFLAFGFLFGPFFQQFFWDYDSSFHNKMFNTNIPGKVHPWKYL